MADLTAAVIIATYERTQPQLIEKRNNMIYTLFRHSTNIFLAKTHHSTRAEEHIRLELEG